MLESLFNRVEGLKDCNFIEEAPTQVFSCEISEIFKNNFFYRMSPLAASGRGRLVKFVLIHINGSGGFKSTVKKIEQN